MKFTYLTAPVMQAGGLFKHALRAPKVSAVLVCAVTILAATGALGLSLASIQPAHAGGTCLPASYSLPTVLSLATAPAGLYLQDDGVTHYGVSGDSIQAVREALTTCAPSFTGASNTSEYLAYTSYTINWSYDVEKTGDTCRLNDVKVGLHLSQLQPALMNQAANTTVTNKWTSFIAGLRTHEDGHKAVDIAKAQSLLVALKDVRTPCTTIGAQANSLTNTALQNLIMANAAHDTQTDYGRDQGATW